MPHRRFSRLEEFIELARTGDIYQEQDPHGQYVVTFRAKSRRNGRDHLRAERLSTDLITKGLQEYVYRTRSRTGTLFSTRDRHNAPAFLATSAQESLVALVEVPIAQHSLTGFVVHHYGIARDRFSLNRQEVSA